MTYLHRCPKHGEFESEKKAGEVCPKCGREAKRLFVSATAFHPTRSK